MKRVLSLMILVCLPQLAQAAEADFVQSCAVPGGVQSTTTLSVLPEPVLAELRAHISNIGPADGPFNASDMVQDRTITNRRFLRAFVSGSRWVIAYESGGIGYNHHVVAIDRIPNGDKATIVANIVTVGQATCIELARWASPNYPMNKFW